MLGFRPRTFIRKHYRVVILNFVLASLLSFAVMPSYASLELDLDMQPLFDSISTWFTTFLPILSIGGGIAIAVALVAMIIASVVNGVKSRM